MKNMRKWIETLPNSEIITIHEEIFQEAAKEGAKSAAADILMPAI